MAVSIHCLGADPTLVARALSAGTRRVACTRMPPSLDLAFRCVRDHVPDLVVVAGSTTEVAALAVALSDDPSTENVPVIAWGLSGTPLEATLMALGARVIGDAQEALLQACQDALDTRDGKTVRVDGSADELATTLHGRRAIVADDDPAVAWFFADALRRAGCDVDEVLDGHSALARARGIGADLVLCDIRMPKLDGLRLCRALRADPILADVGVVLLSWKTDWLRRAEQAGAEASAYLAKHAAPEDVIARAHEALEPHLRLERRFREEGTVRGLLDGISTYRLLRMACAMRGESRVTAQCGSVAYEVLIRGGAPRMASRVKASGQADRGVGVLGALLAERSGRFVVTTDRTPIANELEGTLLQQVAPYVASIRSSLEQREVTAPLPPAVLGPPPVILLGAASDDAPEWSLPIPLPSFALHPPAPKDTKTAPRKRPARWNVLRRLGALFVAALAVALGMDVRPAAAPTETVAVETPVPQLELDGDATGNAPMLGARAFHGTLAHRR